MPKIFDDALGTEPDRREGRRQDGHLDGHPDGSEDWPQDGHPLGPSDRTVELGSAFDWHPVGIEPGAVLASRYQIEAIIGEGGSGQVFRAWDRVLGEPIALKLLRADRAREKTWIRRLAREVRVARAIRHANVCRVFDLANADGHWFVSMELATGGTLRDSLRDGAARSRGERLVDARAICAGLAAIHLVGITHRDVTPQNVLRMSDGRLVLSDFGLASSCADTTIEGGTPRYMPPETAMGQRSDQRSDVWQLGSLLHELLFGRRPEWESGSKGIVLRSPGPEDPSSFDEDLARLVSDCLAPIPADRPASAVEVAARLAEAEVAHPRGAFVLLVGRRRGVLTLGMLIGLAAGVFLADAAIRHRIVRRNLSPPPARSGELGEDDRRFLKSLAASLDAQGRHEEARHLSRVAATAPAGP
jgi:tRNA A-37 threonylcarbamoyl transferase component Bud32